MTRRKPNRSRRIVKKLLKRADPNGVCWNRDAISIDGGKRHVTGRELMELEVPNMSVANKDRRMNDLLGIVGAVSFKKGYQMSFQITAAEIQYNSPEQLGVLLLSRIEAARRTVASIERQAQMQQQPEPFNA
jgi:hypothetical protein